MAPRPPIQAVIEVQAEIDETRRNWRMVLFHEDGTPFTGSGGSGVTVEDWQAPTDLSAHFMPNGAAPLGFRKDSLGKVALRGAADVVTAFSWNDTLFTLPPDYRPTQVIEVLQPYHEAFSGGSNMHLWLTINTNGTVKLVTQVGGAVNGAAGSRIVLDGVEFYND